MSENTNAIVERGFMNPTSLKEGMEMAAWIAKSDLAPRDYKDKQQNVLLAMQMGFELGLSPMQAIQNIAVINGRPSIWGDAMLGICQNHRDFESIDENQSTNEKGVCIVKRRGMEPQTRTFTVQDAQKAGLWGKSGPWQTAPTRMLKLRARAFALRDTFADALRGLQSAEEQRDVVETTATITHAESIQTPKRKSEQAAEPTLEVKATQNGVTVDVVQSDPSNAGACITLPQAKRLFAIAKEAGKTADEVKAFLISQGLNSSLEIPKSEYERVVSWASTKDIQVGQSVNEAEMETPGVGE